MLPDVDSVCFGRGTECHANADESVRFIGPSSEISDVFQDAFALRSVFAGRRRQLSFLSGGFSICRFMSLFALSAG